MKIICLVPSNPGDEKKNGSRGVEVLPRPPLGATDTTSWNGALTAASSAPTRGPAVQHHRTIRLCHTSMASPFRSRSRSGGRGEELDRSGTCPWRRRQPRYYHLPNDQTEQAPVGAAAAAGKTPLVSPIPHSIPSTGQPPIRRTNEAESGERIYEWKDGMKNSRGQCVPDRRWWNRPEREAGRAAGGHHRRKRARARSPLLSLACLCSSC